MKIGLVCPYNIYLGGGVQEIVLATQSELTKRGHTVKIITPRPRVVPDAKVEGVIFLGQSTRVKTPQHTSVDISVSVDIDSIDAMFEAEQFDLVHVHEPLVPLLARQVLSRVTCPAIGTFHAAIPDNGLGKSFASSVRPFVRSILKHLDFITAPSLAATGYIQDYVPAEDIKIIPNGIDLKKYRAKTPKLTEKSKTIFYVGRLEKRKGVIYLLEAFGLLRQRRDDVRLVIAGDGPDREKLENYVATNRIPAISFKGFVTDKEKIELMQAAALFCSPAIYGESFGIVLLEAMATGTVVVAGDNPGYDAVMQGRGKWSLVNPKDSIEFSRRLELMLFDDDMRRLWREWAAAYVRQFAYPKIVDQYERLYNEAVAKHKRVAA